MSQAVANMIAEGSACHIVLPAQVNRQAMDPPGERELAIAVLEDGLAEATGGPVDGLNGYSRPATRARAAERCREQARAWVRSNSVAWPYAFLNLCALLGLDPERLRRRVASGVEIRRSRTEAGSMRQVNGRAAVRRRSSAYRSTYVSEVAR